MPRLLSFLLFLSSVSFSQQATARTSEVPDGCPVTTENQVTPFVPPKPYSQHVGDGSFWFGTDKLWTFLPVDGTWELGHYTQNDPTFRQKLFLWRQGYDWRTEPRPNLKVVGRRLDSPSAPLLAERANNITSEPAAIVVGINFPTVGCWEITGRYEDDALTFVVWITSDQR